MDFTVGRIIICVHPSINTEARISLIPRALVVGSGVFMDCLSISRLETLVVLLTSLFYNQFLRNQFSRNCASLKDMEAHMA